MLRNDTLKVVEHSQEVLGDGRAPVDLIEDREVELAGRMLGDCLEFIEVYSPWVILHQ